MQVRIKSESVRINVKIILLVGMVTEPTRFLKTICSEWLNSFEDDQNGSWHSQL